jgi:ribonuclease HI
VVKVRPMPWVEATLRGAKVLARAKADGTLVVSGGRVEVRYKPNDGRAYLAGARNVLVAGDAPIHPDDACGPADSGGPASPRRSSSGQTGKPATHGVAADAWIAYTDGACSGNPGPAGSGVVLVSPEGKMHEGHEYLGEATNNVAELTAILRALEWIPREARAILVHTDSQYAIGVLQKGWKAKANGELVARTKRVLQERGARLTYVPGHAGVPLNERADELAREAITTRTTVTARVPARTSAP